MCLIAYAPKDKTQIPNVHLQRGFARNDDAWGFMFAADGQVIMEKDTTRFDHFASRWKVAPRKTAIAVHFRYGTSGGMSRAMAHPFPVLTDSEGRCTLAMMHNGVMDCVQDEPNASDTAVFVRDVLQPQLIENPHLIESVGWRAAMGTIIGNPNKFVFMRADGQTFFVNGWQGSWEANNVWYSNLYSIEEPKPKPKPATPAPVFEFASSSGFGTASHRTAYSGPWNDDEDIKQEPRGAIVTRKAEPLDELDEAYEVAPDLWGFTENELYNWIAENTAEDITDAIIDMRGGR